MNVNEILRRLDALEQAVKRLLRIVQFTKLTTPRTSTNWDGDARSTTAKTRIDLEAEFGLPADVKMVLVRLIARDSGSAAAPLATTYFGVAPNDVASSIAVSCWVGGNTNDVRTDVTAPCPCDDNGDIWYQVAATGAGTMDCWLEVWGYWR